MMKPVCILRISAAVPTQVLADLMRSGREGQPGRRMAFGTALPAEAMNVHVN
jgi:hypothetical protein